MTAMTSSLPEQHCTSLLRCFRGWLWCAVLVSLTHVSMGVLTEARLYSDETLMSEELRDAFEAGQYEKVSALGTTSYRALASQSLRDPAIRRFALRASATSACAAEAAQILRDWADGSKDGGDQLTERDISRVARQLYHKYKPYRSALQREATGLPQDAVEFLTCLETAFRRQEDRTLFGVRREVIPHISEAAFGQLMAAYLRATRGIGELEDDCLSLDELQAAPLVSRALFEEAVLRMQEALPQTTELMEKGGFEQARVLCREVLQDFARVRLSHREALAERRHEDARLVLEVVEGVLEVYRRENPEAPPEVGFFGFRSWVARNFSGQLGDFAATAIAKEYYRLGDYDKARSEIAGFLKTYAESELAPRMVVLGALVDIRTDRLPEATSRLQAAVRNEPSDPEVAANARFLLGYCYLLDGQKDEAVEVLADLTRRYPSAMQAVKARQLLERLLPAGAVGR